MAASHGFEFRESEVQPGKWAVSVCILNVEVWWVLVDATDKYEAVGKGLHAFVERFRQVMDEEYDPDG